MLKIYVCLFLLLISCSTTKKPEIQSNAIPTDVKDVIVFLTLKISKEADSTKSNIELVSIKKVDGKMRVVNESEAEKFDSFLSINIIDDKNNVASNLTLEHPLFRHVEYSSEDRAKLLTKNLSLQEDSFFVRLQIKSNYSKISISETIKNTNTQEIYVIKI